MFLIWCITFCISFLAFASEQNQSNVPRKPRILHGHTIFAGTNHPLITTQDPITNEYFWNPVAKKIKITSLEYRGIKPIPITSTKIWGALVAFKKKLPGYNVPTSIIAEIVLCVLDDPKAYNKRERYFIAYEFISDSCYNSIREQWLSKFFLLLHKPLCLPNTPTLIINFCGNSTKPSHPYVKVHAIERYYDLFMHNYLIGKINTSINNFKAIKDVLKTDESGILSRKVALLATYYNKIEILKQLAPALNFAKCYTGENKNLLQLSDNPEMTTFLLEQKVSVDHIDNKGLTPLLSALQPGRFSNIEDQVAIIDLLIKAGALTEETTENAQKYAEEMYCCDEIIQLLKK